MVRYTSLVTEERKESLSEVSTVVETPEALPAGVFFTEVFDLPLPNSAPTTNVKHTIDLTEIRRGCFRQDCIPSVDRPEFVRASELRDALEPNSLGVLLAEAGRFYPFPMLETREIVNDILPSGQAVAVTYCPLCGTGIVFDRTLDTGVVEFGVSGMLWQSNLLMYNRADELQQRNLWSQVLGQAVVGERAGQDLVVVPSDVITYGDWLAMSPQGETLTTGTPRDPYAGEYYSTAQSFAPNFDATASPLDPMTRVHGIIVNGQPKAYVTSELEDGLTDIVAGERIFVIKTDNQIRFVSSNAEQGQAPTELADVEGFWFSWAAAHPETLLFSVH